MPPKEYDQTVTFPVPAGRNRTTPDKVGHDWASIGWHHFQEDE